MNLKTVADAIAARYVGITATVGNTTETVSATASLHNQVGKLALLVYPPTGDLSIGLGRMRDDSLDFPVRLLRDPFSMPARSDWLYAWTTALRDRLETNMDLDLSYVAWAQCVSLRVEPDGESYASLEGSLASFDVVEFIVRVHLTEVVSSVAI